MLNCSYADSTGDGRVSAHMQIFRGVVPKRFYELVIIFATRAHGRAREAQPHMDVRLRRLPIFVEKAVQVLSISYKWSPEYLSAVDTS